MDERKQQQQKHVQCIRSNNKSNPMASSCVHMQWWRIVGERHKEREKEQFDYYILNVRIHLVNRIVYISYKAALFLDFFFLYHKQLTWNIFVLFIYCAKPCLIKVEHVWLEKGFFLTIFLHKLFVLHKNVQNLLLLFRHFCCWNNWHVYERHFHRINIISADFCTMGISNRCLAMWWLLTNSTIDSRNWYTVQNFIIIVSFFGVSWNQFCPIKRTKSIFCSWTKNHMHISRVLYDNNDFDYLCSLSADDDNKRQLPW